MWRYTLRRLLQGIITVWFIATATFVAMHAVPGDPLMTDKAVTARDPREPRGQVRPRQAGHAAVPDLLGNMLKGDFGISYTQQNRERERHHPRTLSGVRHARHSRRSSFAALGGILLGRAHGLLPQSAARHRHHVPRDPRHLGAELRVRRARAACAGAAQRAGRHHAVARGRLGHGRRTCSCRRWCSASAPWRT